MAIYSHLTVNWLNSCHLARKRKKSYLFPLFILRGYCLVYLILLEYWLVSLEQQQQVTFCSMV